MTVAIIQARMMSSRLQGKVMMNLCGKTILERVIERTAAAKNIDKIVVATSYKPTDEPIIEVCNKIGIATFRGSEENVLNRFYHAAIQADADVIVRITADDPLKDPEIIERIIKMRENSHYDYVSNTIHPTFPEGIDCEVFTIKALSNAYQNASLPSEKEHVTPYIWKHPDIFRIGELLSPVDYSYLRWTVDCIEDYKFVEEVYNKLYQPDKIFYMNDIIELLKKYPYLSYLNAGHVRNEGYLKSVQEEKI